MKATNALDDEAARFAAVLDSMLRFSNSYSRLQVFLSALEIASPQSRLMQIWFRELGEAWEICDNIGVHSDWLRAVFVKHPTLWPLMMNAEELEKYSELPDRAKIWRGCGDDNRLGLSWSLDREVAANFPYQNRYRQERPRLLEASVPKNLIVAYKGGRQEREIIALVSERHIMIESALVPKEVA